MIVCDQMGLDSKDFIISGVNWDKLTIFSSASIVISFFSCCTAFEVYFYAVLMCIYCNNITTVHSALLLMMHDLPLGTAEHIKHVWCEKGNVQKEHFHRQVESARFMYLPGLIVFQYFQKLHCLLGQLTNGETGPACTLRLL